VLKEQEEKVTIQIIQLLARARTSSSQIGREGFFMKPIYTSAEASELQADYHLTVLTLRRSPEHFRIKNFSVNKRKQQKMQPHLFYIEV